MKNIDKQILETINIKKTITTLELCDKFSISESSCRRALSRLENKGEISRYFGGANSIEKVNRNIDIYNRFDVNDEKKEAIAKKAAELIKPNSTLILLGGTTVFRICKYIKNMKLTVVTNSMIVFNELYNRKEITLILLGGQYNKEEAELTGVLTITNSKIFICDHLFMGASGYVRNVGFTTDDLNSIELYSWCISVSEKTHVLFDSSKFVNRGKAITASVASIDSIITDSDVSKELVSELKQNNLDVVIA